MNKQQGGTRRVTEGGRVCSNSIYSRVDSTLVSPDDSEGVGEYLSVRGAANFETLLESTPQCPPIADTDSKAGVSCVRVAMDHTLLICSCFSVCPIRL